MLLTRAAFFLRPNGGKDGSNIFLAQHGDEPTPAYSLRHLDASQPPSKNRYAVALYDAFVSDVLFGEVLMIPEWTQPTMSAEAIRQNGGIAPPPEPILPSQFTIHLYNPDQDVAVRYKPKTWNTQPSWEFEMPQRTFRQPSNSTLDQTQTDPAASDLTPKLKFTWRKDGALSKDFACYLSGKTSSLDGRKKSKEPDITISIFKSLKEITLYEPNLYRVEMEDFKGLEVVLLLGAIVIRDVYLGPLKETFHVSNPPSLAAPTSGRKLSSPSTTHLAAASAPPDRRPAPPTASPSARPEKPQVTIPQSPTQRVMDPRTKWEIDAENAQLRQRQAAENKERRRRAEEEERRTKKLLEAEEKAQQRKQAEVEKETERLRKLYGSEEHQVRQQRPPQSSSQPTVVVSGSGPNHRARYSHYLPQTSAQRPGPYLQAPQAHGRTQSAVGFHQPQLRPQSSMSNFNGQGPHGSMPAMPQLKEKRSFFGLLRSSEGGESKLSKKRSSLF